MVFVDLHLNTAETAADMDALLDIYVSNINYVYHLHPDIQPVVVIHAGFEKDLVFNGVRFVVLNARNASRWKLARLLKTIKPDAMLMHGLDKPLNILFIKAVLGNRTAIISQNHKERPVNRKRLILQRIVGRVISGFLFVSKEQGMEWVEKGVIRSSSLIYEVMEGSITFGVKNRKGAKHDLGFESNILFLWVGRLTENKDPLCILKAFAALCKSKKSSKLLMIYGTNELESEVRKFIDEHALQPYVELTGELKRNELEEYYNAADYFLLGSYEEGSGYALCEAMACGCVPIVTNIPSFKTMLGDDRCGYLFEPGNNLQLAEILLSLNDAELEAHRDKVLKKFRDDLSFEAIGSRLSEIIRSVAKDKAP